VGLSSLRGSSLPSTTADGDVICSSRSGDHALFDFAWERSGVCGDLETKNF